MEFTVNDLSNMEDVAMMLEAAGTNAKGESFKLHVAELHGRPMGGMIRLENSEGMGFDVGRVGMTANSFSRPIVTLTTFNSCRELTGRFLMLCATTDASQLKWEKIMADAKKDAE